MARAAGATLPPGALGGYSAARGKRGRLKLNENEARKMLLVRAVEIEDREGTLFTDEDRAQAVRHAGEYRGGSGARAAEGWLARRAEFAAGRLATRHPGIERLLAGRSFPRWLGIVLPLLALAAGFAANEFGNSRRLDLLAVPLLGTIAWNLAVYLWTLIGALRRQPAMPQFVLRRLAGAIDPGEGSAVQRGVARFRRDWLAASAPLTAHLYARTLHLGAALFALGLTGGIYLRALVIEYRAGWESTFLGPEAVHAILAAVLGPASLLTGVAIPPVAEIAAMRWLGPLTGAAGGGVNAAPWIHLWVVTLLGAVAVPRLLLSTWHGLSAWRMARRFPVPGREDFYVRRLLRDAGGTAPAIRVTPYAYTPAADIRAALAAALRGALGDRAEVRIDPPVGYGEEEAWAGTVTLDPDEDYHLLLFSLSATPEAENHGEMAARLARLRAERTPGTRVVALVDDSAFRRHFAGQDELAERLASRQRAWAAVLAEAGVEQLTTDLAGEGDALLRQMEGALAADALMGAGR